MSKLHSPKQQCQMELLVTIFSAIDYSLSSDLIEHNARHLTSKNVRHIANKVQQNSSLVRISVPQSFASNAVNLFLETPETAFVQLST